MFFKKLGYKKWGTVANQVLSVLKKLLYPFTLFKKSQVNFYIKLLKKAIDFKQQIPYIFKYQRERKSFKGFKKFPRFFKKVVDFLKTL